MESMKGNKARFMGNAAGSTRRGGGDGAPANNSLKLPNLQDIEELRNPGWCNVEVTGEADLVRALHATATTAPYVDAPTAVSHLALTSDLQTLACDADGHVGAQYFARCPDAGADDADAQAACRAVASREALASVVRAHPATSLLRYGLDADAASNLPPLYLRGCHRPPR